MYCNVVYTNDTVKLCHDACKICWDKMPETKEDKMCNYIANRVNVGHESVIEHSNVIMEIMIDNSSKNHEDVLFLLKNIGSMKYLNIATGFTHNEIFILLGGSIRAYKEMIRNLKSYENELYRHILNELSFNLDKCFFTDFIKAGLMEEKNFKTTPNDEHIDMRYGTASINEDIDLENIDSYTELIERLIDPSVYDTKDLFRMLTVTINFKNMSRAATHQLVRHRNGITQSSMRYILFNNAEVYEPDAVKDKVFSNGKTFNQMAKEHLAEYNMLIEEGIPKEDARGLLPINIKNKELKMTFTIMTLIKFLQLRTDVHAQKEIRDYAIAIYEYLVNTKLYLPENLYDYLIPNFEIDKKYYEELNDILDINEENLDAYEEYTPEEDDELFEEDYSYNDEE